VFVICDKGDAELTQIHPFYYAAQFKSATKLVVLPLAQFHKVGNELFPHRVDRLYSFRPLAQVADWAGLPTPLAQQKQAKAAFGASSGARAHGDVCFLYSTGRCGSTLLCNTLEGEPGGAFVPQTVVLRCSLFARFVLGNLQLCHALLHCPSLTRSLRFKS